MDVLPIQALDSVASLCFMTEYESTFRGKSVGTSERRLNVLVPKDWNDVICNGQITTNTEDFNDNYKLITCIGNSATPLTLSFGGRSEQPGDQCSTIITVKTTPAVWEGSHTFGFCEEAGDTKVAAINEKNLDKVVEFFVQKYI